MLSCRDQRGLETKFNDFVLVLGLIAVAMAQSLTFLLFSKAVHPSLFLH